MTTPTELDRSLTAWLVDEAPRNAPDALLAEVHARAASTRRRPAWATTHRWMAMETRARFGSAPRIALVLALMGVALALAAVIAAGGSPARLPAPYGTARNGALVFAAGDGDLWVADSLGSDPHPLVTGPGRVERPLFSHDGTRIAFLRHGVRGSIEVMVVTVS